MRRNQLCLRALALAGGAAVIFGGLTLGSLSTVLPLPGAHVITCVAVDSDGSSGSGSIAVIAASPVAVVNHPGDGETRVAGVDVPFVGRGCDFEDGTLIGASPAGKCRKFSSVLAGGLEQATCVYPGAPCYPPGRCPRGQQCFNLFGEARCELPRRGGR